MLRVNLACGRNKIKDCINVDLEPSVKPDLIHDIAKPLPWKDGEVDEVFLFHAIEHIPCAKHLEVLKEIHRVMAPGAKLWVSYPEFEICAKNWMTNYKGEREFWKATLYGRQHYPSDFHVALMDTKEFKELLLEVGFETVEAKQEPLQEHNTILQAIKGEPMMTYEDVIKKEIFGI